MMDDLRERVFNALGRCESYGYCEDEQCPYYENIRCLEQLRKDALSLLKAQEPHVMTPKEVEQVEEQGVVWCESKVTGDVDTLVRYNKIFESPDHYLLLDEIIDCDDYLKYYRLWNAKPTDEQREAVKWE